MSNYTVTLDALDLTPRHIGRMAVFSCKHGDDRRVHEGRVNDIRFHTDQICNWGGKTVRDTITADVRIGDEWYPLTHVRFAETDEPWGKGEA